MNDRHLTRRAVTAFILLIVCLALAYCLSGRYRRFTPGEAPAALPAALCQKAPTSGNGSALLSMYEYRNMSLMESGDLSGYTIAVYEDGLCEISLSIYNCAFDEETNEKLGAVIEKAHTAFYLSRSTVEGFTDYLKNVGLDRLPSDVGREGCDGYSSYVTIYLNQKKYRSGGYLADEEMYNEITGLNFALAAKQFKSLCDWLRPLILDITGRSYVNF